MKKSISKQKQKQLKALDALIKLSEDLGLYDMEFNNLCEWNTKNDRTEDDTRIGVDALPTTSPK